MSSGLLLYVASQDDHDRRHYQAALLPGQGQVSLHVYDEAGKPRRVSVPAVRAALEGALPVRSTSLVRTLSCSSVDDMSSCGWPSFEIPAVNNCPANGAGVSAQRRYADDWRCASLFDTSGSSYATSLRADPVGDARTVQEITGVRSAAAERVLADGGVVVLDRAYLSGGRAKVDLSLDDGTTKAYSLPAVYVAGSPTRGVQAVWSPAAAARIHHVADDDSLLLSFTRPPSKSELKAAHEAIGALGVTQQVYVETGYHSDYGPGLLALVGGAALVTLLATGVATGLAQADARPDHATLAAVGATPRLRRRLAGAQSWSLALLGTFLGVIAGWCPQSALVWARPDFDVVMPWRALTLTLLVVPALAGVGAFLLTRSRLPLDRRLT